VLLFLGQLKTFDLFCQHVALVDQLEVVDQSEMGMMMEASVEGEEMKDQKMEVLQPWGPWLVAVVLVVVVLVYVVALVADGVLDDLGLGQ
jgi:hypothetical protein